MVTGPFLMWKEMPKHVEGSMEPPAGLQDLMQLAGTKNLIID